MTTRTFAALALTAIVSISACGQISGEPIEGTGKSSIQGKDPTALEDPSADPYTCAFTTEPQSFQEKPPILPMECTQNAGQCWYTSSAPGETGVPPQGGSYDDATGEYDMAQLALCTHFCHDDADCPAPASGTSTATCWMWEGMKDSGAPGMCLLPCDSSETCPDGFYCLHNGLSLDNGEQMPKACYSYDAISGTYDAETNTFIED